jgi:hypothetical protein
MLSDTTHIAQRPRCQNQIQGVSAINDGLSLLNRLCKLMLATAVHETNSRKQVNESSIKLQTTSNNCKVELLPTAS